MLVLGRGVKDSIILTTPNNEIITISVERITGKQIRLGIDAPNCIDVQRGELLLDIAKEPKR
jgi:carbon storage regulator CsrA